VRWLVRHWAAVAVVLLEYAVVFTGFVYAGGWLASMEAQPCVDYCLMNLAGLVTWAIGAAVVLVGVVVSLIVMRLRERALSERGRPIRDGALAVLGRASLATLTGALWALLASPAVLCLGVWVWSLIAHATG